MISAETAPPSDPRQDPTIAAWDIIDGKEYARAKNGSIYRVDRPKEGGFAMEAIDDPAISRKLGGQGGSKKGRINASLNEPTIGERGKSAGRQIVAGAINTTGTMARGLATMGLVDDAKAVTLLDQIKDAKSWNKKQRDAFVLDVSDTMYGSPGLRLAMVDAADKLRRGEIKSVQDDPELMQQFQRAIMDPRQREAYRMGTAMRDYAEKAFPADPRLRQSFETELAQGVGSIVPFLIAGMIPGGQAYGAMAGIAAGRGEALDNAEQYRDKLDNLNQWRDVRDRPVFNPRMSRQQLLDAVGLGTLPGASESLPIETLLERIPKPKWAQTLGAIGKIGAQAIIEGGQEGAAQLMQNIIANYVYDPEQDVTEGVVKAAGIGAIIGGGLQTGVEAGRAITGREEPPQAPPPPAGPTITAEAVNTGQTSTGPVPPPPGTAPMAPPIQPQPSPQAGPQPARTPEKDAILREEYTPDDIAAMPDAMYEAQVQQLRDQGVTARPVTPAPMAPPRAPQPPTPQEAPNVASTQAQPGSPDLVEGVQDALTPGTDIGNGFKQGSRPGEKYRVGSVASVGGAVSLEKRLPAGTIATFYVGKDGALIDGDSVNLLDGDSMSRLWIPPNENESAVAAKILNEMGQLDLNSPRRSDLKKQLKALVTGEKSSEPAPPAPGAAPMAPPRQESAKGSPGTAKAPVDLNQMGSGLEALFGADPRDEVRQQVQEPTPAQAEAGNYKHAHVKLHGLDIAIETPKGGRRTGTDEDGQEWTTTMPADYGRIKRSEGADGDQLDIYIGDNPQSQRIWVIDQQNLDGSFDEHKAVAGVDSAEQALQTYASAFSDGSGAMRAGGITELSVDEFRDWVKNGDTKSPLKQSIPQEQTNVDAAAPVQPSPDNQASMGAPAVPAEPVAQGSQPGTQGSVEAGAPVGGRGAQDYVVPDAQQRKAFSEYLKSGKSIADLQQVSNETGIDLRTVSRLMQDAAEFGSVIATRSGKFRRAPRSARPDDLITWISGKGGIQDQQGDMAAIVGGKNPFIPGKGPLVRPKGVAPDTVLEAAIEEGYLPEGASIRDLYDAIDANLRGQRQIRVDDTTAEQEVNQARQDEELNDRFPEPWQRELVKSHGVDAASALTAWDNEAQLGLGNMDERIRNRAGELVAGGLDADSAVERAAIELADELAPNSYDHITEIPLDEIYPKTAPADGEALTRNGRRDQRREEEEGVQRPAADVSRAGEEGQVDAQEREEAARPATGAEAVEENVEEIQAAYSTALSEAPGPADLDLKVNPRLLDPFEGNGPTVNLDTELGKQWMETEGDPKTPEEWEAEGKRKLQEWKAEARRQLESGENQHRVIISLFDYTGKWSQPFVDAGYTVIQYDMRFAPKGDEKYYDLIQHPPLDDIMALRGIGYEVYGVLSACPCTTFAASGARWWEGRHDVANREMVEKVFGDWVPEAFDSAVEYNEFLGRMTDLVASWANPTGFHVVENPMGRLGDRLGWGKPQMRFQPHNFGDPYTKRTQLWGNFSTDLPTANVPGAKEDGGYGSFSHMKGSGDKTRSDTFEGFAWAFFMANNAMAKQPSRDIPNVLDISPAEKEAREDYWGTPMDGSHGVYRFATPDEGEFWNGMTKEEFEAGRAELQAEIDQMERDGVEEEAALSAPQAATETGADGKPQMVMPGMEPDFAGAAQNAADKPLKPKVDQLPADQGLFGDTKDQVDVSDVAKRSEEELRAEKIQIIEQIEAIDLAEAKTFAKASRDGMSMAPAGKEPRPTTEDDIKFVREKLAAFKAKTDKSAPRPDESDFTIESFLMGEVNQITNWREIVNAPVKLQAQSILQEAADAFQGVMKFINEAGFKFREVNASTAAEFPDVRDARALLSMLAGASSRVAADQRALLRKLPHGSQSKLDGSIVSLAQVITDAQVLLSGAKPQEDINALFAEELAELRREEQASAEPASRPQSKPASWVIKNKETGEVVMETYDEKQVQALNTEKYEAVPIMEHLQSLNRTAGEAAKSAATNIVKGVNAIGDGLTALFNDPNKLGSGPSFDEDTYQKALPYFRGAMQHFGQAGQDVAAVMRALLKWLRNDRGMSLDAIQRMQPYIVRFVSDVRDGKEQVDVSDSNQDLERDSGPAAAPDGVGAANVPASGAGNAPGAGARSGSNDGQGNRAPAGGGAADVRAPTVGKRGDLPIPDPAPEPAGYNPTDSDGGRGDQSGQPRLSPDNRTPEQVAGTATDSPGKEQRLAAQQKANRSNIEIELANSDNIAATVPLLHKPQQEDVQKIEQRFEKGPGMLITNGTGTGKTFTAAGVIKRFERQGKTNILVVLPSQPMIASWQRELSLLGIDTNALEDTKDVGKGISLTTYANLGQNMELANREWDLVVADEAHHLMMNEQGKKTEALESLRAITKHPRGYMRRTEMLNPDLMERRRSLVAAIEAAKASDDRRQWESVNGLEEKLSEVHRQLDAARKQIQAELDAIAPTDRTKGLFLSATPFAWQPNVDWAEGYLFDYPADTTGGGYNNAGGGYNQFMVENFGYRMRYGKLTKPESDVDTGIMEREFHERLRAEGSLSGRVLENGFDYDRRFQLVENGKGAQIDQAFNWLREQGGGFMALHDAYQRKFDYLARARLLEAMKAESSIPHIKAQLGAGRKVVVFWNYNEGEGFDIFEPVLSSEEVEHNGKMVKGRDLYAQFLAANPYIADLNFSGAENPRTTLAEAFGEQFGEFTGKVTPKKRIANLKDFNNPAGKIQILGVQAEAGGAGLSAHDTVGPENGGQQRILFNLGLPTKPVAAIQQEGRIMRDGQMSNAMFRYFNTGTNWERFAFASRIAQRASTAENLAMGNKARTLKDSFIDAFEDSADWPVGHESEGVGGIEIDRGAYENLSDFQRAKTHYFANQKKSGRRDQREGVDYFATPEPLGVKMLEWARVKDGDRLLEPSAGHGAISRYFPETTNNTIIEPSFELLSKAALRTNGKTIQGRFEDHNIVNKYDAIIMNPPFGSGGATAIQHLEKATQHLRNGGRVVALIPTGPAADAKFEKWWHNTDASLSLVGEIKLPSITFKRAGTGVMTRVVIIEKHTDKDVSAPVGSFRDVSGATTIEEFFDAIENTEQPKRTEPLTKELDAPVNGEITAGGVDWRLFSTGATLRSHMPNEQFRHAMALMRKHGGTYFRKELIFDTVEKRDAFLSDFNANPQPAPVEDIAANIADEEGPAVKFDLAETVHEKRGNAPLWVATIRGRVDLSVYDRVDALAKANGGYYSNYRVGKAVPGFQFKSAAARQAFLDAVNGKSSAARIEDPSLWVSMLGRAVDQAPQDKASAEQWASMIRRTPGVREAEWKWSGLQEWLRGRKGTIARQEIAAYLSDNSLQITESVLVNRNIEDSDREFSMSDFEPVTPDDATIEDAADFYLDDAIEELASDEDIDPDDVDPEQARDLARDKAREYHANNPDQWIASGSYSTPAGNMDFTVERDQDGETSVYFPDWQEGIQVRRNADEAEIQMEVRSFYDDKHDINDDWETYHDDWTEPGGEEYTELILTAPFDLVQMEEWSVVSPHHQVPGMDALHGTFATYEEAEARLKELPGVKNLSIRSSQNIRAASYPDHFPDANPLTHLRFKTRYTKDGKKVMAIEEIQADLGQEVRDLEKRLGTKDEVDGDRARLDFLKQFPFNPTEEWAALALRRAFRWAADNGFEVVAWTPGEVQARRYNKDRWIKEIDVAPWTTAGERFVAMQMRQTDGPARMQEQLQGRKSIGIDRNGVIVSTGSGMSDFAGKNVRDVFGQELGDKLVNMEPGTIETEELRIGGKGHRYFYDRIIPKVAEKIIKPWGAKLTAVDFTIPIDIRDSMNRRIPATERGQTQRWWAIEVNDAMRGDVQQGIPMWARGKKRAYPLNPARGTRLSEQEITRHVQAINEILQRVAGRSLRDVQYFRTLYDPANSGAFQHVSGLIKIALEGNLDPQNVARHESIHLLLRSGVISKTEWGALRRQAKQWRVEYEIDRRYRTFLEEMWTEGSQPAGFTREEWIEFQLDEEAVAEAFAFHWSREQVQRGRIGQIFDRLVQLFEQIRNYLTGNGFQTAEQVFDMLESGQVAQRTPRVPGYVDMPVSPVFSSGRREPVRSIGMLEPSISAARDLFDTEPGADGRPQTVLPGSERLTPQELARVQSRDAKRRAELQAQAPMRAGVEQREDIGGLFAGIDTENDPQGSLFARMPMNVVPTGPTISRMLHHLKAGTSKFSTLATRKLWDRFVDIKQLQQDLQKMGSKLPQWRDVYLSEELYYGKVGGRLDALKWDRFEPIMRLMRSLNLTVEEVDKFLMAMHAKERNDYIASINPKMPDGGSGILTQDALDYLRQQRANGKAKALMQVAREVYAMNRESLDARLADGLLTQEKYDELTTRWKYYVPLRGWAVDVDPDADPELPRVGSGFSVRGKEFKAALGRDDIADSPLAYSFVQAQEGVVRGEKNRVSLTFLRLMRANPSPDLWVEVKGKMHRFKDASGQVVEKWIPETGFDKDLLHVKLGGKTVFIRIKDRNIRNAMLNLGADQMSGLNVAMHYLNRWLSSVNTQFNPEFILTNLARDIVTAGINVTDAKIKGLETAMLRDMRKAFAGAFRGTKGKFDTEWAKHYREFNEAGGKISFFGLENIEDKKKRIQKEMARLEKTRNPARIMARAGRFAMEQVSDLNQGVENALRLSAYVNARKMGATRDQAASLARNLTVNFNKRGEWGTVMNAWYLFYNAGIQGTVRMVRAIRRSRKAQFAVGALVMQGFLLDMANRWLAGAGDDDDEETTGRNPYDALPFHVKERNMIIFYGPGKDDYFKWPLPWGYNTFYVAGQQISQAMNDPLHSAGKATKNIFGAALNAFNPIGGSDRIARMISPTVLDPVLDIEGNRNAFDVPIMPDYGLGDQRPDSEKAWKSTPDAWKSLARELNALPYISDGNEARSGNLDFSPETLQYWTNYFGGGAMAFATRTYGVGEMVVTGRGKDIETHNIPFVRRFYGTPNERQEQNEFYQLMDEIRIVEDEAKLFRGQNKPDKVAAIEETPAYKVHKEVKNHYNTIAKLKKNVREVEQNARFSDEEKDKKIEQFEKKIRLNMTRALRAYYEASGLLKGISAEPVNTGETSGDVPRQ